MARNQEAIYGVANINIVNIATVILPKAIGIVIELLLLIEG